MRVFYTIGIYIYGFAIWVAAFFNAKAKQWINGRQDWKVRLAQYPDVKGCVWFHCASLGEFEQGRPLIEMLRSKHPDRKILLTFFSPSGYEIRKDYGLADVICYLPLDTPLNARYFLKHFNPSLAVFIKYEIWHNFLWQASKQAIPVIIASGIFRPGQIYFKAYGGWFLKSLKRLDTIFTQDERSVGLLKAKGISHAQVAGDTRFDRVIDLAEAAPDIPEIDAFRGNSSLLVAGSTWPEDEALLLRFYADHTGFKLIIVPHEIGQKHLSGLLSQVNDAVLWSEKHKIKPSTRLLIVDTIGMLSNIYQYADISYVGGGFGAGIHNTLEPATFGVPVLFGPNYTKFNEAKELVMQNAAIAVHDYADLKNALNRLLSDAEARNAMGLRSLEYVRGSGGATTLIFSEMERYLV